MIFSFSQVTGMLGGGMTGLKKEIRVVMAEWKDGYCFVFKSHSHAEARILVVYCAANDTSTH